mgnify:FL=1
MAYAQERYLGLLSQLFTTPEETAMEIIAEREELGFPKPTELFISDVHGEYEEFSHILRNGCGSIRKRIDALFSDSLNEDARSALAALVYYPEYVMDQLNDGDLRDALGNLASLCASFAKLQPVEAVYDACPKPFGPIIEKIMSAEHCNDRRTLLFDAVFDTATERSLTWALCTTIQGLATSQIHIVGDVYDRGPNPDLIMDEIDNHPEIDIQWGNHDVVWMGAALGQRGCIAHVVRNCARYGNLSILSDAYGINILPLANFASRAYKDDPCVAFKLKGDPGLSAEEYDLNVKIQKAMAILQFKVEAKLIDENPSFELEDRKLLHLINRDTNTIVIDGIEYKLTDTVFPTVDWEHPYQLTDEEEIVMQSLEEAFIHCEKLQRHIALFLERGSLYKIQNNTLMFHACVPLNADGSLRETNLYGEKLKGRKLFDAVDRYVRAAFTDQDPTAQKKGADLLWYLWLGVGSPLFAKSKMATFELYLIAEKEARKEVKNPFYQLYEKEIVVNGIFEDFGMDPATARIVCGHVPVKVKDGEDPIKCDGKVVVIDGGMSAAYQKTTGIAGFTLISDAQGVSLATHEPFAGSKAAIENHIDLQSIVRPITTPERKVLVSQTDEGKDLEELIGDLEQLLATQRAL